MAKPTQKSKTPTKSAQKRTNKRKSKAPSKQTAMPNKKIAKNLVEQVRPKTTVTKITTSRAASSRKPKIKFRPGDHVVYPTHGVGLVQGVEKENIGGNNLDLVVVTFDNDRMTLRVPTNKMDASGLRQISSRKEMDDAVNTLKGRARVKRTMWSRRAQEYETKINSGDPGSIAQVVRDLHRNVGQPDQSFSERQIYEVALEGLIRLAYISMQIPYDLGYRPWIT
jgi:CarD family transcriptional regulator